jgi:AcrR family transcriptional regulator
MPKRQSPSATDPRSAPYHHGDLRRALIDTALTMVTEEGAWNFTLREVARRAGVSHAAPYNHFTDKAALLAEVATLGFNGLRGEMEAAADRHQDSARGALLGISTAYIRFAVERPAHYRLMFGPDLADRERHPGLDQASDAAFAVLTSALERGQAGGQIRAGPVLDQAVAAWSMVHGLTLLLIDRRLTYIGVSSPEAERQARLACEALIEGLGHPERSEGSARS